MEFSALNFDFGSSSPDDLCSKRPSHASVKKVYPHKRSLFYRY